MPCWYAWRNGAALVDHADDANRRGDTLDVEPVGAGPVGEHVAKRVGERNNVVEPSGHSFDAPAVEYQPVAERCGTRERGKIVRVGREDRRCGGAQRGAHSVEGRVAPCDGGLGKDTRGITGLDRGLLEELGGLDVNMHLRRFL